MKTRRGEHQGNGEFVSASQVTACRVVPTVSRRNPYASGSSGGVLKGAVGFAYAIRF